MLSLLLTAALADDRLDAALARAEAVIAGCAADTSCPDDDALAQAFRVRAAARFILDGRPDPSSLANAAVLESERWPDRLPGTPDPWVTALWADLRGEDEPRRPAPDRPKAWAPGRAALGLRGFGVAAPAGRVVMQTYDDDGYRLAALFAGLPGAGGGLWVSAQPEIGGGWHLVADGAFDLRSDDLGGLVPGDVPAAARKVQQAAVGASFGVGKRADVGDGWTLAHVGVESNATLHPAFNADTLLDRLGIRGAPSPAGLVLAVGARGLHPLGPAQPVALSWRLNARLGGWGPPGVSGAAGLVVPLGGPVSVGFDATAGWTPGLVGAGAAASVQLPTGPGRARWPADPSSPER